MSRRREVAALAHRRIDTMFTKTMTGRVLGVAMLGALACTQACTPNEDANVSVHDGVDPNGYVYNTGDITYTVAPTYNYTYKPPVEKPKGPMPPAGYTARFSKCQYLYDLEGTGWHTNSRIIDMSPDANGQVILNFMTSEPNSDFKTPRQVKLDWAGGDPVSKRILNQLRIGKATRRSDQKIVPFAKVGSMVILDGDSEQWVLTSNKLAVIGGDKVHPNSPIYLDSCLRNKYQVSKDTLGYADETTELAAYCIVEDQLRDYNAYSGYVGYYVPLQNYATAKVGSYNSVSPDGAVLAGINGSIYYWTNAGAGLNDYNGTERRSDTGYFVGEQYCHMIVNSGYEVPGAKRPSSKSLPAPGKTTETSYIQWRPVNNNLTVVNDQRPEPPPADPVKDPAEEPAPEPVY